MKVSDVIGVLDELAPPELAYSWDRVGLHTGSPDAGVSKVLVALSVTSETLRAARRAKADMIVSHHPLIWEPLKTLRTDLPEARLSLELASAGIACYGVHTNLDVVPGGVNDVLADRIGLRSQGPLIPVAHASMIKLVVFVPDTHLAVVRKALSDAGAGVIGDYTQCSFSAPGIGTFVPGESTDPYSGEKGKLAEEEERRFETLVSKSRVGAAVRALYESHPYEEPAYDLVPLANRDDSVSLGLQGDLEKPMKLGDFASFVRERLEISHVRLVGKPDHSVKRVGVLGGAGGGTISDLPPGLDVFVTGDVKYHDAISAAERGLPIIDAGHRGTEKWIVPALADYLKKHLRGLKVTAYVEPEVFQAVTG